MYDGDVVDKSWLKKITGSSHAASCNYFVVSNFCSAHKTSCTLHHLMYKEIIISKEFSDLHKTLRSKTVVLGFLLQESCWRESENTVLLSCLY